MTETIYDHPLYYDILFGWDRSAEAQFYAAVFDRFGVARSERIAEIACGSGQVARLLARSRWRVTGIDNRAAMVSFMQECARADGVVVDGICADMETISVSDLFAGAFNPMSSFRLLQSDAAADAHLRAMASALRPGGVYVLDLTFGTAETTSESWTMERDGITVEATDACVNVVDRGVKRSLAWGAEAHLRPYSQSEFEQRVDAAGGLEAVAYYGERKDADGIGRFDVDRTASSPLVGRAMVVLRKPSAGD